LLIALKNAESDAWERFVDRYLEKIIAWVGGFRLQPADTDDVVQDVLVKLFQSMKSFEYDGERSFKAYLRKVVHSAVMDFFKQNGRVGARGTGDSAVQALLDEQQAAEDLKRRLEQEFDLELLEAAMERVKACVQPETWEAFRLSKLQQQKTPSAVTIAKDLGMTAHAVHEAVSRVKRMIREVVSELDRESGE